MMKEEILYWFHKKRLEQPDKFFTYLEIGQELGGCLTLHLKVAQLYSRGYLERRLEAKIGYRYVGFRLSDKYIQIMELWVKNGIYKP